MRTRYTNSSFRPQRGVLVAVGYQCADCPALLTAEVARKGRDGERRCAACHRNHARKVSRGRRA